MKEIMGMNVGEGLWFIWVSYEYKKNERKFNEIVKRFWKFKFKNWITLTKLNFVNI
jgi:hypothetical protein